MSVLTDLSTKDSYTMLRSR
uniref:Uncharacterized protein n=1 Tax=Anguilla anguilla TaxID=7936 RepID=A0A0E9UNW4_ANGAN